MCNLELHGVGRAHRVKAEHEAGDLSVEPGGLAETSARTLQTARMSSTWVCEDPSPLRGGREME